MSSYFWEAALVPDYSVEFIGVFKAVLSWKTFIKEDSQYFCVFIRIYLIRSYIWNLQKQIYETVLFILLWAKR